MTTDTPIPTSTADPTLALTDDSLRAILRRATEAIRKEEANAAASVKAASAAAMTGVRATNETGTAASPPMPVMTHTFPAPTPSAPTPTPPGARPTPAKYDKTKNRLDLVPVPLIEAAARAFTYGADKYSEFNWALDPGLQPLRLYRACIGHLMAFQSGEIDDPESGLCHLDHAAAALAMLICSLSPDGLRRARPVHMLWSAEDPANPLHAAIVTALDRDTAQAMRLYVEGVAKP